MTKEEATIERIRLREEFARAEFEHSAQNMKFLRSLGLMDARLKELRTLPAYRMPCGHPDCGIGNRYPGRFANVPGRSQEHWTCSQGAGTFDY